MKTYYIDIDGTMTNSPNSRWGKPNMKIIEKVKELIKNKNTVIIWTAGGWQYAKDFCNKYNLFPTFILPKPDYIIDDNLTIRKEGIIKYLKPEEFISPDPTLQNYNNLKKLIKVTDKHSHYYNQVGVVIDCESGEYYDTQFKDGKTVTIERANLKIVNIIDCKNKQCWDEITKEQSEFIK